MRYDAPRFAGTLELVEPGEPIEPTQVIDDIDIEHLDRCPPAERAHAIPLHL